MGEWVSVGRVDEPLGWNRMRSVALDDERSVALARLDDGRLVAFDDTCTHEECPLSDGDLSGAVVTCMCHSAEFDVETGEVLSGPAEEPIAVYDVRVVGGTIEIRVEE